MQYTGVKDKNGLEIYEGDIVDQRHFSLGASEDIVGIVKYVDGSFVIEDKGEGRSEYLWLEEGTNEVVGNIHEDAKISRKCE